MREILGVFEVFLGIFKKTKEKKDRAFLGKGENQRKSAKICVWARCLPLGSSP